MTEDPVNETAKEYTKKSIQGEQQPPYIVSIYHKNSTKQYIEIQETPVLDENGTVIAGARSVQSKTYERYQVYCRISCQLKAE